MQTSIKNKFKYVLLFITPAILFISMYLQSCNTDKEASDTVELLSFGPMPVARGGELRFIGANLDKVTSIVLPDNIEIQAAMFTSKSSTLLKITVPQEAIEGFIVLKTPDGDITTKTALGFSEPIIISSFIPATIKPGSELTITGDYLNLIGEVIFTDRISVAKADFISQSRTEIKLLVPGAAQTGKFAISNAKEDPILIYTDELLNVVLPVFTGYSENPVKAGTTLTINGTDLDLVTSIKFAGDKNVTTFTSQTATSIELVVPLQAQDGKISLFPASNVAVEAASELVLQMPDVSLTPTSVKSRGTITVTGTNLDLITEVTFSSGVTGTIEPGGTSTTISIVVPDAAVSGEVTFKTTSNKTLSGGSITVINPVFSSFAPAACKAKDDITITGTNLDLVATVNFGGTDGVIKSVATDGNSMVVTVPVGAVDGKITLKTINGTSINSATNIDILVTLPLITSINSDGPGKKITIEGTLLDLIRTIYFADANGEYTIKCTDYGVKSATKVEFYHILGAKTGDITPKMVTFDGDEGFMPSVYCGATDPILATTIMISNFDGGGASQSTWAGVVTFGTPPIDLNGTACMKGLTGNGWNWTWAHNWDFRPALANPELYVLKMDVLIVTPSDVDAGILLKGWDTAIGLGKPFQNSTNGKWKTITFDILTAGMSIDGTGDWGIWINGSNFDLSGVFVDNLRFDLK